MPPKSKYTREEIISVALDEVRRNGFDALTARSLAGALGCSPRPIFTVFDSMDEVQSGVIAAARREYDEYVRVGLTETQAFKGVGTAYIRFATEQPKLFMMLFMHDNLGTPSISSALESVDNSADKILNSIVEGYGLGVEVAHKLYMHMWLYTHGIATLIANRVCAFSSDDISNMLTEVFTGLLAKYRTDGEARRQ